MSAPVEQGHSIFMAKNLQSNPGVAWGSRTAGGHAQDLVSYLYTWAQLMGDATRFSMAHVPIDSSRRAPAKILDAAMSSLGSEGSSSCRNGRIYNHESELDTPWR